MFDVRIEPNRQRVQQQEVRREAGSSNHRLLVRERSYGLAVVWGTNVCGAVPLPGRQSGGSCQHVVLTEAREFK